MWILNKTTNFALSLNMGMGGGEVNLQPVLAPPVGSIT